MIYNCEIGRVFDFIRNGKSISQNGTDGYPITRIETIADGKIDEKKFGYAGIFDLKDYEDFLIKKNDILMSHINSEKHLGKVAIFNKEKPLIHGMNLLNLRPRKSILLGKYAFYYFNSMYFKRQIPQITKKSVNQASFNVPSLKTLLIPLPPLPIQKKIVQVLDKAQELIDLREKQIKLLDDLEQSIFYDMFGDPVTNPKGWGKNNLSYYGEWKSGGTPNRNNAFYFQGNIPWITSGELSDIYISESKEQINEKAINESSAKIIESGSLLLGMYDTAALKSSITMSKVACNQAIAYAKLDDKLCNTIFVYWYIKIGKEYFRRMQRGVRQKNMNITMIKNIPIFDIPITRQNSFAEKVQKIEAQKALMQKSLKEMKNNYNSLMQRAFRGDLFKEDASA